MSFPVEDLDDRKYVAATPFDSGDIARFGQLAETAKDVVKSELTKYFSYNTDDGATKIIEVPNIEKFEIGSSSGGQDLETFVNLIMSFADTPDRLPMIAITSASVTEKKLNIGSNFVDAVQYPSSVSGTVAGPYDLTEGWTLNLVTWPLGAQYDTDGNDVTQASTITIGTSFFTDIHAATTDELVNCIKSQALYYTPKKNSNGTLCLETGGPLANPQPNRIEITGGTTGLLNALGFTVGQYDDWKSAVNQPRNRYSVSADLNVNITVMSDDMNTMQELADVVTSYFTYYLEKRFFQLLGRLLQPQSRLS